MAKVSSLPEQVIIGNIYCPNDANERALFLNSLAGILNSKGSQFILGGVFNCSSNLGERRGGDDVVDTILCNFVDGIVVMDLPLANGDYSWFSFSRDFVNIRMITRDSRRRKLSCVPPSAGVLKINADGAA